MLSIFNAVGISKSFGGLMALNEVDLAVGKDTIVGLIGPNGSGKTTFFNVISGIYPMNSGQVHFGDQDITGMNAPEVNRLGLARTFQEIQLFYDMTVLENAMLGCHRLSRAGIMGAFLRPRWVKKEEQFIREKAFDSLEFVGLADCADDLARSIPYGHQRLLEIARAISGGPQMLMLDEPAAGMNQAEAVALMAQIQKIREHGITVLLVEHNMRVVMDICEQITVLNYGEVIARGTPKEIQANEQVIEAYLGGSHRQC
jgi:ABC-type branched-subunit amino acid transport system ATPase component